MEFFLTPRFSERLATTSEAAFDLAIDLARSVVGRTSPNPPVGAVVVRDGVVCGMGATQPPGGPHAEVVALRAAGNMARGATLYSTLEPCTFQARTPPCTSAIVEAGLKKVCYVARDTDPRMGPGAEAILTMAGIEVLRLDDRDGVVADLLAPFRCRVAEGRPLVSVKYAMTLDGRIAAVGGDSRWVSGPASRREVHLLRDRVDGIMVGVGTVLADNPELTTRLEGHWREVNHPLRVVVDSRGRSPLGARLFDPDLPGRTLVATVDPPSDWVAALKVRGVDVECVAPDSRGRVDLRLLLASLARRGLNHLLVEGGAELAGAFSDSDLIDQVFAYIAPKLVGGAAAPGPLGGIGVGLMADARPFQLRRVERHGEDLLLTAMAVDAKWWSSGYGTVMTQTGESNVYRNS